MMIVLVSTLLIFALVAYIFGLQFIVNVTANIAIIVFVIFITLFLVSLIAGPVRRR